MIRIQDLIEAEKRVDDCDAEIADLSNVENWSARESLDPEGRRHVHFDRAHFDVRDAARSRRETAYRDLVALRRAYFEGM